MVSAASSTTSAMPARIVAADRMLAVDHELDVQAVVAEQQACAAAADELAGSAQRSVCRRPASAQLPSASGTASSRNALARAITCAPRSGS